MLDRYLEKNIQNKLELFNILHSKTSATMNDVLSFLPLSIDSIHTLVNELNFDLVGLAEIKKQTPYFTIVFHGEVTVMELASCHLSILQCPTLPEISHFE